MKAEEGSKRAGKVSGAGRAKRGQPVLPGAHCGFIIIVQLSFLSFFCPLKKANNPIMIIPGDVNPEREVSRLP